MDLSLNQIEQAFRLATDIDFGKSRSPKEPASISLIFERNYFQTGVVEEIYTYIFNYFQQEIPPIFVIRKAMGLINLSIVDRRTANSINCNNLKYDKEQFVDFTNNTASESGIVFIVGFYPKPNSKVIGISRKTNYLVCKGFETN